MLFLVSSFDVIVVLNVKVLYYISSQRSVRAEKQIGKHGTLSPTNHRLLLNLQVNDQQYNASINGKELQSFYFQVLPKTRVVTRTQMIPTHYSLSGTNRLPRGAKARNWAVF